MVRVVCIQRAMYVLHAHVSMWYTHECIYHIVWTCVCALHVYSDPGVRNMYVCSMRTMCSVECSVGSMCGTLYMYM